jgi:hypothetical protein
MTIENYREPPMRIGDLPVFTSQRIDMLEEYETRVTYPQKASTAQEVKRINAAIDHARRVTYLDRPVYMD